MTWSSCQAGTAILVFQDIRKVRPSLGLLSQKANCPCSGYSGVVIYTRNETCAPIRAEEGLTGLLCPANSSTPYRHLPENQQIGGYPSMEQLSDLQVDPATLDCEGRCVILEFPAFVVLGVYCPAARDETRDDFRQGFINLLDARIRNLVSIGKRVILTGDLNISVGEIDSAHLTEAIRKGTGDVDEFVSAPVRRIFNQLVEGAKVLGARDPGREVPALHDICRAFHPDRRGMYTCWETRVNARPGNYGARIDYILCSLDMKNWFSDCNIQEGLMVCYLENFIRTIANKGRALIIVRCMPYSRIRSLWMAPK